MVLVGGQRGRERRREREDVRELSGDVPESFHYTRDDSNKVVGT